MTKGINQLEVDTFFTNFDSLLLKNTIRISDLETELGNSLGTTKIGYFSRLRTSSKHPGKLPSLEVLSWLSKRFNVPIDFLIKTDLRFLDTDYQYLVSLINKIITMTQKTSIHWKKDHSFPDNFSSNTLYHISSDIPNLGHLELKPVEGKAAESSYFIMSLKLKDHARALDISTKDEKQGLSPYITTLYMAAVQEAQSIKLDTEMRDAITDFLAQ